MHYKVIFMQKNFLCIFLLLISIVITSILGYTSWFDNRTASNLSSYCSIDFRGFRTSPELPAASADFTLTDRHFSSSPLEDFCYLTIDGKEYKLPAASVLSISPNYAFNLEKCKYTNTLVFHLHAPLLNKIKQANSILVTIKYTNWSTATALPLNEPDLNYWKNQL